MATPLGAEPEQAIAALRANIEKEMPGLNVDRVAATPIAGLFEVVMGTRVVYLTHDARYLLDGDLVNLRSRTNLTESSRAAIRVQALESVGEENMVVFQPKKGPVKHSITVFTDVSCPYCVRLHKEIDLLTKGGTKVRYLLYPRAGMGSPAHKTMVSVWCAENRGEALTKAKFGESIPEKDCDNPIAEHIKVAQQLGLQGTPMIILENGQVIPGYRPAADLLGLLEQG
jgi:thiol:disulfide interchange protein DsbC